MLLIPFPSTQPGSLPPSPPTGAGGETALSPMAGESSAKLPCQAMATFTGWAQAHAEPPHAWEETSSPARFLSPSPVQPLGQVTCSRPPARHWI